MSRETTVQIFLPSQEDALCELTFTPDYITEARNLETGEEIKAGDIPEDEREKAWERAWNNWSKEQ